MQDTPCRRTSLLCGAAVLLVTLVASTSGQCLGPNDRMQPLNKEARNNLYMGQQNFTLSLLQALNRPSQNENIFFSPYSTYHALLLAYLGSQGNTEKELREVLNLNWATNKFDVMTAYRLGASSRAQRARNSSVTFRSADKIFLAKETNLRECLKDLFNDELETIDIAKDPEGCRQHINKFVADVTDGHIKDILVEGTLGRDAKVVLANAAFFKGDWARKFKTEDTVQSIFYTNSEKRSLVNMMYRKDTFNHAVNERLGCHVLEIPYLGEDDGISMMIFLPPSTSNGLDNVLSRLTPEALEQALDEGMAREVELKLPRFNFEKTYELVPILASMGINDLFTTASNLTGFSETTAINLDGAVHKAKIEVNEEGSTAAAATVLFSFRSSRPAEPAQFFCDHPFLFLIYDHRSKAVLFAGVYRTPDAE